MTLTLTRTRTITRTRTRARTRTRTRTRNPNPNPNPNPNSNPSPNPNPNPNPKPTQERGSEIEVELSSGVVIPEVSMQTQRVARRNHRRTSLQPMPAGPTSTAPTEHGGGDMQRTRRPSARPRPGSITEGVVFSAPLLETVTAAALARSDRADRAAPRTPRKRSTWLMARIRRALLSVHPTMHLRCTHYSCYHAAAW